MISLSKRFKIDTSSIKSQSITTTSAEPSSTSAIDRGKGNQAADFEGSKPEHDKTSLTC